MGLSRYRLGELLKESTVSNRMLKYDVDMIRGVSSEGKFILPRRETTDLSLYRYKIVDNGAFVYNATTLSLGAIAYRTEGLCIVSHLCVVFYLNEKGKKLVDPDYLFMFFRRKEFYRQIAFRNFGSQRAEFTFREFSSIVIDLPPVEIQRKYVRVYLAVKENLRVCERGQEDLKLVCDMYIEELRRKLPCERIGAYIREVNDRNTDKSNNFVMGLSTQKTFREPSSRVNKDELGSYKIVRPNEFAFVPTTDTWKLLAFGLNTFGHDIVVSPIYKVFSVDTENLLPEYLALWLSRSEFDRYARFHSLGSARENFSFEDLCNVRIPIPDIKIQRSIANIYTVAQKRKFICERLKSIIRKLCPILIKGAIDEAKKEANLHS